MNCFHRTAMQVAVEKSQAYLNLTLSWFAPDDSQKTVQMGHLNPGFVVWWEELLPTLHWVMGLQANCFHLPESAQAWTKEKGRDWESCMGEASRNTCRHVMMLCGSRGEFFLSPCGLSGSQEPHFVQVPLLSLWFAHFGYQHDGQKVMKAVTLVTEHCYC